MRLERAHPTNPAVVMESVHHFFKEVAGNPLIRPAWFFDVRQQGEAIPDVGTHLVDGVQWECFPDQALDWRKDIKRANRPPLAHQAHARSNSNTPPASNHYPDYLKADIGPDRRPEVFANGEVTYTLRGIHAKVAALWRFEAPPGGGDTHLLARARHEAPTCASSRGAAQHYKPALYVEQQLQRPAAEFERRLSAPPSPPSARHWPGLDLKPAGASWEIVIPDKYRVGHEATFRAGDRDVPALSSPQAKCPPGKCPTCSLNTTLPPKPTPEPRPALSCLGATTAPSPLRSPSRCTPVPLHRTSNPG